MDVIDENAALALLEATVQEKGEDFVYENSMCEYVLDTEFLYDSDEDRDYASVVGIATGTPGCIVGQVLVKAGLVFGETANSGVVSIILGNESAESLANTGAFTDRAVHVLAAAQQVQDGSDVGARNRNTPYGRGTWGEALSAAREAALRGDVDDDEE